MVRETMNQPGIAMKSKDDRLVRREERVEGFVTQAVWVFARRLELHEVDHVDNPDLQIRRVSFQEVDRRERFHGRDIAAARHHHVRLASHIIAGPFPDADARCAVLNRRVHLSTSRRNCPCTRVASASTAPALVTSTA